MLALPLLLALAPQNPITLPPRPKTVVEGQAARPNFEKDVLALRRSRLRAEDEEATVAQLATRYPDFAARLAPMVRTADADLLTGVLRALARVGGVEEAEQVELAVMNRAVGDNAVLLVQVLAQLHGANAKDALLRCLHTRSPGTRRAITDQLRGLLDVADAGRLLDAAQRGNAEVRLCVLQLLGATPSPEARLSLRAALGGADVTHAVAACESLIAHGPALAEDLQQVLGRAATDRSFGFAAVALTRLELGSGTPLLRDESVPHLRREVDGHDAFLRVASAVALAQLAFRSTATDGDRFGDAAIVDSLLLVATPGGFVPAYSLLNPIATEQLRRFSGKSFATAPEWTGWWGGARAGFVGMRRSVALDMSQASLAMLLYRTQGRAVRLRGEQTAVPNVTIPDEESYVLHGAELAALVKRLQDAGFMSDVLAQQRRRLPVGLALPRSLEVRIGTARAADAAPAGSDQWMDRFVAELDAVVQRERWQLYHDPAQGDFMAFWRAEHDWLTAHSDRVARDTRLKDLIVKSLARADDKQRSRALAHLNEIRDLPSLLQEADGLAIVAAVQRAASLDAEGERLLALALRTPSEGVWRQAIDAVDKHYEQGGRAALPRLLSALGAQRVLQCLDDPRPHVRVAVIREVANLGDLTAVPAMLLAARDADKRVQEAAVSTLGLLRSKDARQPLLDLLPSLDGEVRRAAWLALGRIGGEKVLPVLLQASTNDSLDDKRAAIQALGKLDDPQAPEYLASLFEAAGRGPLGNLALLALQDQGPLRARAALREALGRARDKAARAELAQVLGDFQDPIVVPDLIDLLDDARVGTRVAFQLAAITGVDLVPVVDRTAVMREWWTRQRDKSQAQWFLNAVKATGLPTDLEATQLEPRAGVAAVPELTRILTTIDRPHVRLLALALLRDTTQRDFGALSFDTGREELVALADRYRIYAEGVGKTPEAGRPR